MWAEKSKLDILLDAKILSSHLQWIQTTKHRLKILHFYINLPIFAIWWVAHITLHTTPVVANAQRLIKVINKKLRNQKVDEKNPPTIFHIASKFCLDIYLLFSSGVTTDPFIWQLDCVHGNCKNCPGVQMTLVAKIINNTIPFSKWASKKQLATIKGARKEKDVFSLHTETATMKEAIKCKN